MLRKAFTLIELIFVIVLIGIMAAIATSRMQTNNLSEARDQVMNHMRYAQHLALTTDFFLGDTSLSEKSGIAMKKDTTQWFKRWWQIQFHTLTNSLPYSIYSDHATNSAGYNFADDPEDKDLIAKDPLTGLFIVKGGNNSGDVKDELRLQDVDLKEKYGITKIKVKCPNLTKPNGTSAHVKFDALGRPHCTKSDASASFNPFTHLVNSEVNITLSTDDESLSICVEPETGYIHGC